MCALLRVGVVLVALGGAAVGVPASDGPAAVDGQPIRVLLMAPGESGELSRHVARFDESLKRSRGPLVRARTLSQADVIVQLTSYRRAVDEKGQTQDWWEGEWKPLKASTSDAHARLGPAIPERFALLVIDRVTGDAEAAVELLADVLSRALRREPPSADTAI